MGLWDLKATKKMNSLSTAKGNRTQKPWTVARGPLEHARLPLKEMLAWALTKDRDWGLQVQGGVGYLHSFLSSTDLVPRMPPWKTFWIHMSSIWLEDCRGWCGTLCLSSPTASSPCSQEERRVTI